MIAIGVFCAVVAAIGIYVAVGERRDFRSAHGRGSFRPREALRSPASPEGPGRKSDLHRSLGCRVDRHDRREQAPGHLSVEDRARRCTRIHRRVRRPHLRVGGPTGRPLRLDERPQIHGHRLPDGVVSGQRCEADLAIRRRGRRGPTALPCRYDREHGELRQLVQESLVDNSHHVPLRRLPLQARREWWPAGVHHVDGGRPVQHRDVRDHEPVPGRSGVERLRGIRLLPGHRTLRRRHRHLSGVQSGPGGFIRPALRRGERLGRLLQQRVPRHRTRRGARPRCHLRLGRHRRCRARGARRSSGARLPRTRRDVDEPGAGRRPERLRAG